MTLLVTRPSPYGERLLNLLTERGIKAIHTPMLRFAKGHELELLPEKLSRLRQDDLIFVLSQQAVKFAHRALSEANRFWPDNLHYYAIGQATAEALNQVSHRPIDYPKNCEISENLLRSPELQSIQGKRALILRGNGGRQLLAETLGARGADVDFCECYRRELIDYNPAKLIAEWQNQCVDTIIITSGEILRRIYEFAEAKSKGWLLSRRLITISERLSHLARELGFNNITLAESADSASILSSLE